MKSAGRCDAATIECPDLSDMHSLLVFIRIQAVGRRLFMNRERGTKDDR